MKKTALALILILSFLVFARVTVKAIIDLRWTGSTIVLVNQPVEFNVTVTDWGTPPYSYQWYTELPNGNVVAVPGATSSTFEFIEPSHGIYFISVNITDSVGNYEYAWFPPAGVYVTVLASPTSEPTPTPTPKVEPFPTTLVVASIVLVAVIGIGLLVYFKKRKR
jgi:multisubunit Na+/H+ antiporter MnhC subunit